MINPSTLTIHTKYFHTHDKQTLPVLTVGQGKPVVMLHGFGMDAHAWLPFVLPLAHKHTFYLPYLRGFSKVSDVGFSQADFFADYANDVNALCEQFHLHEVSLAGISMGAMTIMKMNELTLLGDVEKCLLIDQSPVILNSDDWQWGLMGKSHDDFVAKLTHLYQSAEDYTHLAFDDLPMTIKLSILDPIATMLDTSFNSKSMRLFAQFMKKYPEKAMKMRDMSGWQQQRHIIGGYLYQNYDFTKSAATFTTQTTVAISLGSRLYAPAGQRRYADLLPNATTVEIPKAGHALPYDRPLKTYQTLATFLEQ